MPSHLTFQKTPFNINSLMYTCDTSSPLSSDNNVYSFLKCPSSRSCNTSGVTPSIIDCKSIIPPRLSSRKIKKKQPKKVVLGKPYIGKQKMSSEALKELSRQASLHSSPTTLSSDYNNLNRLNYRSSSFSHHIASTSASTDILSISRNLRANLSKAKIKLMSTLKCSDTPEDIQMYKSLYSSSSSLLKQTSSSTKTSSSLPSSSSSFNNTCSPSLSSSASSVSSKGSTSDETSAFHLRLVTDDSGSVSVVSDSNSNSNCERLSPMCATDYSSDDDTTVLTSSESCTYLFGEGLLEPKEECAFNYIPPIPQQQLEAQDLVTIDNMNILLQSWKLEHPSSLLSKNDELRDVTEDQIDSWLQRGGGSGGHHSIVMATDQELADLLDFDV